MEKVGFDVQGKRVLFVENVSDPYDEDLKWGEKWWVENDRKAFVGFGCEVISFDPRKCSLEDFEKALQDTSIVHFCGGSMLYLIALLKEKKLDEILTHAVREEKILYTGSSAESMITAKNLSLFTLNEDEADRVKMMKDFSGLSWVDFFIAPHTNKTEFVGENKKIVEALPGYGYPVLFLNDTQVIWVEDGKLEVFMGK